MHLSRRILSFICVRHIQGVREMQSIAQNYQRRYPHLLHGQFDNETYHFRHTERVRTRDSFNAFASSLFGDNEYQEIDAKPPTNEPDLLLKVCLLLKCSTLNLKLSTVPTDAHTIRLWTFKLAFQGYANCPAWKQIRKSVKKSRKSEIAGFKTSSIFLDMIDEINARLGFDGSLSIEEIENIHDLCRYETAWNPANGSIWCSVSK